MDLTDFSTTDIDPAMWEIIKDGTASFEDLWKLDGVQGGEANTVAIYIILYPNLSDSTEGRNGLYVGKTNNLKGRKDSHALALKKEAVGSHYKIGQTASGWKLVKFATFPIGTPDLNEILQISEQLTQILFHSMNPTLFAAQVGQVTLRDAKWRADKEVAKALYLLAESVFKKTGWQPPSSIHGCNWNSSLTEGTSLSSSLWICQDVLDERGVLKRIFHTGGRPRKLQVHKNYREIRMVAGGTDHRGSIMIGLSDDDYKRYGFSPSTLIYPVVEVYLGDQDITHPVPFARLPEPGPFEDWSSMNKLGEYTNIDTLILL